MNCQECLDCYACQSCDTSQEGAAVSSNTGPSCSHSQPKVPQSPAYEAKFSELVIWVASGCNLRCDYCFVWNKTAESSLLHPEVVDAFPDFVTKNCAARTSLWMFGGEPLLGYEKIQELYAQVMASCTNQITWGLTSNCTLLTEEKARWLGERGFGITCSIDGTDKLATKRRYASTGQSSFAEARAGVLQARKFMSSNLGVRACLSPEDVSSVYDWFLYWLDQGFYAMALEPVYEVPWPREALTILEQQLAQIGDFMVRYPRVNIAFKPFSDAAMALRSSGGPINWKMRCGLGQYSCGVDVDGELVACQRFTSYHDKELFHFGNVLTGIDQEKRKALTTTWEEQKPYPISGDKLRCDTCLHRSACMGGCPAASYELFGTRNAVPQCYCDIQETLVKALALSVLRKGRSKQFSTCH